MLSTRWMHSIVTSDRVMKIMACNAQNHCSNWYDNKFNDTLSLAQRRESDQISISSTVSEMPHFSNEFAAFLLAVRRSLWIQKRDRFSFCVVREYCTLPCLQTFQLAVSGQQQASFVVEACFCCWQGAGFTYVESVYLTSVVSVARLCLQRAWCLSSRLPPFSSSYQQGRFACTSVASVISVAPWIWAAKLKSKRWAFLKWSSKHARTFCEVEIAHGGLNDQTGLK